MAIIDRAMVTDIVTSFSRNVHAISASFVPRMSTKGGANVLYLIFIMYWLQEKKNEVHRKKLAYWVSDC